METHFSTNKLQQKQLDYAKYKLFELEISRISNLSKKYRDQLITLGYQLLSITPIKFLISSDGNTIKALIERNSDKLRFETVLMKFNDGRNSVCLSCMVGCPLGCSFCATGKMGFKANLTSNEISDQVVMWGNYLRKANEKISNIVFMGMGEPLLNLDNVIGSIHLISDKNYMGFSQERITISTSGLISGLKKLVSSKYTGNLALSLHSPFQKERESIMQVAATNDLESIMEQIKQYSLSRNKRITLEYILLDGINDSIRHTEALKTLLSGINCLVNIIPYNPIPNSDYIRPSRNKIFKFYNNLKKLGINTTLRVSMGDSISSSCGQLAIKYE